MSAMQVQALLADGEPGSDARIRAVLDVFRDGLTLDNLAGWFTFTEWEPLALLALYQGGERNRQLAQDMILAWAQNDEDAEPGLLAETDPERFQRLLLWGLAWRVRNDDEGDAGGWFLP